jgi:dUTPase
VEGIIDAGFRGELLVHVYALPQVTGLTLAGEARTLVEAGSSVGQLIVSPIPHVEVYEVDKLPDSERGERGFGSSGR